MAFTPEQIAHLWKGREEALVRGRDLVEVLVHRNFRSPLADEFAKHGLSRRLGTSIRCIERVFEVLPPEQVDIPTRENAIDATVNIQAFIFNTFGCCDNLAWVWVHERGVTRANGQPLDPTSVGLGPRFGRVRQSFSNDFQAYLEGMDEWFAHLKNFRDALAHRVPLYIPPFSVTPQNAPEYNRLDAEAWRLLLARDHEGYTAACERRDALRFYRPVMTHSFREEAPFVLFHAQLLADFNTVEDMTQRLLAELDQ